MCSLPSLMCYYWNTKYLLSDFMLSAQKPECKVQCIVGPGPAGLLKRPMLLDGVPELVAPRETAG